MAIQLMSNVKIITSGNKPTTANLLPGQAAFGKLTSDGKYHLFGNTGENGGEGKVVDIVLDTYSAVSAPALDTVLAVGNIATVDVLFKETAEGETLVSVGKNGVVAGTTKLTKDGFVDNGKVVLSANPSLVVSDDDAATMRGFLKVYSKAEVDGMISGAFHVKGCCAAADLPTDAKVGDVWNILSNATNVKDIHGQTMKVGDNVVWVGASVEGEEPAHAAGWDILSGIVDLSGYYTSTQVDALLVPYAKSADVESTYAKKVDVYDKTAADGKFATIEDAYTKTAAEEAHATMNAAITKAQGDATAAGDKAAANAIAIKALQNAGYQTAADVTKTLADGNYVQDADYVHTDANYTVADQTKVSKLITDGDGTKVLKDNGEYDTIELSVVSI